jgi:hypothetical protein
MEYQDQIQHKSLMSDILHRPILYIVFLTVFILSFVNPAAFAGYKDDIGYTALRDEFGSSVPQGGNISQVTQAEGSVLLDHDGDDQTGKIKVWAPNPAHRQFSGKTINDVSASPEFYSGHATSVGVRFYGNTQSIAPGIKSIETFLAGHWLGPGYLMGARLLKPLISKSRIANHSWVGTVKIRNFEFLRRLDWVVDVDEYIQVVGPCRSNQPLLASSFNAIAVGGAAGESGSGSIAVDSVYRSGRACPHLIAPFKTASAAAPVVASAAAVLVELGHRDPGLSTDPAVQSTTNRNGDTIYNAERSEVIKAVLIAGADRVTHNSVIINGSAKDIVDYRVDSANRTSNGLDRRYGAGQINIYQSYKMIAAGEKNSKEDQPTSKGAIGHVGFDYDPFFGGIGGSNLMASYYFSVGADGKRLWASLVWNINIDAGSGEIFDGAVKLVDLDLILYDVTERKAPQLVAGSTDSGGNTENLWIQLNRNKDYMLQVKPAPGQTEFKWDYALAWRIEKTSDPDGKAKGLTGKLKTP